MGMLQRLLCELEFHRQGPESMCPLKDGTGRHVPAALLLFTVSKTR